MLSLLEAENVFTEARTAHLAGLRQALFTEIRARIVETDLSVPVAKGPWWYYERTVEGSDYVIHCRLPVEGPGRDTTTPPVATGPESPDEQVLLDENVLAEDVLADERGYLDVANLAVSPGHTRLAYATDTTGDERFTLRVRDLVTGEDLADAIEGTSYGVAWANDDTTLFYTRPDAANRPYQLWRHRVGSPPDQDALVLEEPDERFHLGVGRTKDGEYVVVEMHSRITSEVRVIPADRPEADPRTVQPRSQGIEYGLEHHGGTFVLLTNDDAENFRVVATPADDPSRQSWTELIPHRADVRLDGVDVFAGHVVTYERREGIARIRVIALPEDGPGGTASCPRDTWCPAPRSPRPRGAGPTRSSRSPTLRYEYSSLVTPRSVYDLDLDSGVGRAAQAPTGARRLRTGALRHRAAVGRRARRHRRPHVDRLSPGRAP